MNNYYDLYIFLGSTRPPKKDNNLRLYSMSFCPFAERARLVLLAKKLPHEIVNINLKEKPEWYFQLHPEGKCYLLFLQHKNESFTCTVLCSVCLKNKY